MALIKRILGCALASITAAFFTASASASEGAVASTGDSFDLVLWVILFVASVLGLFWINSFSKKRARK